MVIEICCNSVHDDVYVGIYADAFDELRGVVYDAVTSLL